MRDSTSQATSKVYRSADLQAGGGEGIAIPAELQFSGMAGAKSRGQGIENGVKSFASRFF
jgi:hypothetical protein